MPCGARGPACLGRHGHPLSYQVLARKWRPQSFVEVTGQAHVTAALRNAIRLGRVPHALLLTGPRGVGKTTLARLLARCLNCEQGPTETPCGRCSACVEIANGTSTDVQEIDAASRTSVDDVRELIEAVRYAPSPGKHRIFVVDEVHMLSTPAFNALLKTLEEPPPRSLFVFATTNPEKIPFTVLSRCQRYDLRRLGSAEIAARLREIAKAESIELSERSLLALAREGDGSLRDALTLLDQVLAFGGGEGEGSSLVVDDDRVAQILDLIDRRILIAIVEALVDGDPARTLEACGRAANAGADARRLGGELLQLLRDLTVLRVAPDVPGLVEGGDADLAELRALAGRAEEARLRRMFRALLREQEDLAWAQQPFAVLEMALVRCATMAGGDDVASLLGRLEALEQRLGGGTPPPRAAGGGAPEPPGAAARATRPAGSAGRGPRGARSESAPTPPRVDAGRAAAETGDTAPSAPTPRLVAPDAAAEAPAADDGAGAASEADVAPALLFDRLRGFVREENRALFAAPEGGRIVAHEPGRLAIALSAGFAATRLQSRRTALEAACEKLFGRPTRVEVVADAPAGSEASRGPALDSDLARRRRQEALNHPALNAALEILGGEILEIRPLPGGRR